MHGRLDGDRLSYELGLFRGSTMAGRGCRVALDSERCRVVGVTMGMTSWSSSLSSVGCLVRLSVTWTESVGLGTHGGHDMIHGPPLTGDVSPFRHMRGREGDSSFAILAIFGWRVFNKVDARLARAHWQRSVDRC
jgi:hypothetical protein